MPYSINSTSSSIVGYSRIEPRTHIQDFAISLSNPIYDPMWLLTQQWRMGEFLGHDGGSVVYSKLETSSSKLNRFQRRDGTVVPYTPANAPLEAVAECLPLHYDAYTRIKMGRHWLKLIRNQGLGDTYDTTFFTEFPLTADTSAEALSNKALQAVLTGMNGNAVDGYALYVFLQDNAASTISGIDTGDATAADAAGTAYLDWFSRLYMQPASAAESNWSPAHIEYQFNVSAPDAVTSGATQTVLTGDEYNGSSMDWYSADLPADTGASLDESPADSISNTGCITNTVLTYQPGQVSFRGMPKKRWWEFEDRNHDIGKVTTKKNDLLQMIVTDFGLIYSNDWFVIPHKVEIGTLTEVLGLVVKDNFGRQTIINRAGSGEDNDWQKWNLFTLSRRGDQNVAGDERFYLAPTLNQAPDSKVIEKISMLRDEMANMVWGVEELISNQLGGGINGKEAANSLLDYLRENPPSAYSPSGTYTGNSALLSYKIATAVPENWIPFIPAASGNANRQIMFQRAAQYRQVDDIRTDDLVRPRTALLAVGLSDNEAYYINEEEVTRTGVVLTKSYQRARWINGKTITWLGNSKTSGKGEGSSGLKFDFLAVKEDDSE